MRLVPLYRASMYVMLTLSTLVLSIKASDYNQLAMLFPLGVAAVGIVAFLTVDRHPGRGLNRDLANLLAIGSFVVAMLEFWVSPEALPLALGHWLVYLQIVKMLLPKTFEDDWFLFLLGLVQVVIGVYLSQSHEVGILLLAWALLSLWTLGLFHLYRESRRWSPAPSVEVVPRPDPKDPYPGLFNAGFVLSSLAVACTTLGLGVLIFLLMPRWTSVTPTRGTRPTSNHLTGFSDEVQLGRMGEILENNKIVMTVESYNDQGRKYRPAEDLLLRGVTMTLYLSGRWSREGQIPVEVESDAPLAGPNSTASQVQRIRLEATDGEVLFAPRPILGSSSQAGDDLAINRLDGTLYRVNRRFISGFGNRPPPIRGAYDYAVWTTAGEPMVQEGEWPPARNRMQRLLEVPFGINQPLREIGDAALGEGRTMSVEEKAYRLEAYLRYSDHFGYTLRMDVIDPTIDPVLDFLTNRYEGHCEYFASALTLLLRAQGIPARMVNGFKGGDWNELFQVMTVREKHAHSWVEALVGQDSEGRPLWLTLDPTPSQERDAIVAKVGGLSPHFQAILDSLRHVWVFYIVGFNQDRQEGLIYGPIRQLFQEAARGFRMMYEAIGSAVSRLFYFESTSEFFSWRGFFVSVVTMLLAVAAIQALRWLSGKLLRRFVEDRDAASRQSYGMAAYRRLLQLLAEAGLERSATETPREFANRAEDWLQSRFSDPGPHAQLPEAIVEAFYRVRFGHHPIGPEVLNDFETRLDQLEANLKPSRP